MKTLFEREFGREFRYKPSVTTEISYRDDDLNQESSF